MAYITSIQQVSVTIATLTASGTATISTVTNGIVIIQGASFDFGDATNNLRALRWEMTDATTITVYRDSALAVANVTVFLTVIDATSSLVVSVQNVTATLASGTGTATISSVDTDNSVVLTLSHTTSSAAGTIAGTLGSVTLTDATTATYTVGASIAGTAGICVVEFQAAALESNVQQFSGAFTTSNTTDTQTISAVAVNNSWIAYGGEITGTQAFSAMYHLAISSTTNVNLIRVGTSTQSRTPYYAIVEFVAGVLNSAIQRGTIEMNGDTSDTATISSVSTTTSFINCPGYLGPGGATDPTIYSRKTTRTNATTITTTRNTSSAVSAITPYEAIEFSAGATVVSPYYYSRFVSGIGDGY